MRAKIFVCPRQRRGAASAPKAVGRGGLRLFKRPSRARPARPTVGGERYVLGAARGVGTAGGALARRREAQWGSGRYVTVLTCRD